MSNRDVVEVYRAKTSLQAHTFVGALEAAGITARVDDELAHPPIAASDNLATGIASWRHAPRILVFAGDAERARRILLELEQREREKAAAVEAGPEVEVVCEECGHPSRYPAAQRGSVQDCRHCGAYVDVGTGNGQDDQPDSR